MSADDIVKRPRDGTVTDKWEGAKIKEESGTSGSGGLTPRLAWLRERLEKLELYSGQNPHRNPEVGARPTAHLHGRRPFAARTGPQRGSHRVSRASRLRADSATEATAQRTD